MTPFRSCISTAIAVLMVFFITLSGCAGASAAKLKVVTGTSLLDNIVQQVGGDRVETTNLIPPAQHPGNFNVRPGDVETLAKANLFILHGWPGEGYADKFIASANNPNLTVVRANIDGNWMTPPVQSAAADKVAAVLAEVDSENAAEYAKSAEGYKQNIAAKENEIKSRLEAANAGQVNVIASQRQADFLEWAGFNVVASYPGANALNPQTIKDLVDKGRAGNVTLIVDNLQDGKGAGKAIAEDLGARQVDLSNFPGGFENTETWEKAIGKNVDLLLEAIGR